MRKLSMLLLSLIVLVVFAPTAALASSQDSWLNLSKLDEGVVGIEYKAVDNRSVKVMIIKGEVRYTYDLTDEEEFFPLQLDNGTYTIMVLEHVTSNQYRVAKSKKVELNLEDPSSVFLQSVQNVNWIEAELATEKALELTEDLATDVEKIQAIYDYIVDNIKYNNHLAVTVVSGYIPNIDEVLTSRIGICYDYASLFAAMARSAGVPTKLLMGDSDYVDEYHAWNEVYLDGEWVTVDTTVDAVKGNGDFTKDAEKYTASKVY